MAINVAVLTASTWVGDRLRSELQPLGTVEMRQLRDGPDLSFGALTAADVVVFGPDVLRQRVERLLHGLEYVGSAARAIVFISKDDSVESLFAYLSLGVRGIVRETHTARQLADAVQQVTGSGVYLSPELVTLVLERYRELCAELRRSSPDGRHPPKRRPFSEDNGHA